MRSSHEVMIHFRTAAFLCYGYWKFYLIEISESYRVSKLTERYRVKMITSGQIGTIAILLLIVCILGAVAIGYFVIRRKIRDFSREAFGTDSLVEGLKKVDREADITPKSVSSATGIYLPQILRDFPEFHFEELKNRAENVLYSYLTAIDRDDARKLVDGTTSELREKLNLRIQAIRNVDEREHFEDIKIHRTEIKSYRKDKGRCSIIFQTALQYINYREKSMTVVFGSKDRLKQAKYEIEMIYIQDRDIVDNQADSGLAMNCPNCGAPLPKLGAKKCIYCDTPIVEFNIRIWNFSNIREV